MTHYQVNKIIAGIADCNRFIAIESPRSAELRPAEVQAHLNFCIKHRANLMAMLKARGAEMCGVAA